MLNFSKLMKDDTGKILISILLGFGLATAFKVSCKGRNTVLYEPISTSELDKIYTFNNKCYKFEPILSTCNKKKQIISYNE